MISRLASETKSYAIKVIVSSAPTPSTDYGDKAAIVDTTNHEQYIYNGHADMTDARVYLNGANKIVHNKLIK